MQKILQIFITLIVFFTLSHTAFATDTPEAELEMRQGPRSLRMSVTRNQAVFHYTIIYNFEGEAKTATGAVDYGRLHQAAEDMRTLLMDSFPQVQE